MNANGTQRSERRGNYAIMMGVLVWIVVGFAAFSVDISLITMSELEGQATADASSHAALVGFRENYSTAAGNSAAQFMVSYNKVGMGTAIIEPGYPIYGQYDFALKTFSPGLAPDGSANAVKVRISRKNANTVKLLLAPMYPIGVPSHDVIAESITAQQQRAIEIVIDMSCSMMGTSSTSAVNVNRLANLGFLDYMVAHPQTGDMLGLTFFAQWAATAPTSALKSGSHTNANNSIPWQPLKLIKTDQSNIRDRMNGICNTNKSSTATGQTLCPAGWHPSDGTWGTSANAIDSCTNPEPALAQAIYQLTTYTTTTYFRGLILFTDGEPNCNTSGGGTVADASNRAYNQANIAWNNDISIWSILYHNGTFDPSFNQNMVRGIGFSQVSPNASDLPAMFAEVAQSLPTALVY